MDSQSFDYWMSQGHYVPTQFQHTALYDASPAVSKVPSLSGSPESSTNDQFPAQMHQTYYPQIVDEPMHFSSYHMPMTPSEFGSDHDSSYCSPRPTPHAECIYTGGSASLPPERTHATSGRRRAQNRAAQRAFRERKERHARDLEAQLSVLTDKYNKLEISHIELAAAYEKLRKTIELLTRDDETEVDIKDDTRVCRRSSSSETLRKLLEILHGDIKGLIPLKPDST